MLAQVETLHQAAEHPPRAFQLNGTHRHRSRMATMPLFSSDTKFYRGTPTYRHRALLITPFKDQRKNRF
jgi:hypothetical protein